MTIFEMIGRQKEITQAARNEGRGLTDVEQEEFDTLQRQIEEAAERGGSGSGGESNPPASNGAENTERAVLEERSRIRDIGSLCRQFGLDPEPYISGGNTLDQVRAAVLEQLQKNGSPVPIRVTEDEEDKRRNAVADGILLRNNIQIDNPAPGAEDFRGVSLKMVAANCLAQEEGATRNFYMMDPNELFEETMRRAFYNPTAAFPAIMDQVVNKAYVEGHKTAAVTFDQFTTKGTLSDFKKADNYYVQGSFGEFLEVPENGELKHTVPVDEKLPQRQLKTYGRQFTMSRKAFINDDMGIVTTLPRNAARAARVTINNQVYKILTGNAKIHDGKALFGSEHKNLLAKGTGITQESVQSMILALGGHTTKDGQAILIRPGAIIVPLGYKFAMYTLFNSPTISASGDVNPLYDYRSQIKVIEDPTLNAQVPSGAIPWFMTGDTADTDFIQVDYLNGQEIPNIRRMETPGQLGFTWDVYSDWGITVLDYRGAIKNPGIEMTSPIKLA